MRPPGGRIPLSCGPFSSGHGLPTAEKPELCCARNPTPHTDASFQRGGGRPTRERVLQELSRGGGVHRCRPADGRRHARSRPAPPTAAARRGEAHALRGGLGPGARLRSVERPLLRVRPPLRDVRRRGRLHLPVGGQARLGPRLPRSVRPGRDDRVHRDPHPRARVRLEEGSAAVGLVEKGTLSKPALKPLTWLLNYSRKYSLWMFQWGLACCAIEMGAALASPRYDVMRLGVIPFPASPRQADLICVSGTVTDKMAPAVRRLYDQMPDPKYVISMGSCANCGGPYWDSYSVTKGVDQILPVDVYVPGCPPRPEALIQGIVLLQERIQNEDMAERWRGD